MEFRSFILRLYFLKFWIGSPDIFSSKFCLFTSKNIWRCQCPSVFNFHSCQRPSVFRFPQPQFFYSPEQLPLSEPFNFTVGTFQLYICFCLAVWIRNIRYTNTYGVGDYTNTMKTTFYCNFDLYQAFKQHGYTKTWKQREAVNWKSSSLIICKLVFKKSLLAIKTIFFKSSSLYWYYCLPPYTYVFM